MTGLLRGEILGFVQLFFFPQQRFDLWVSPGFDLSSFPVRQPWRNAAICRLLILIRQMPGLHILNY